MKRARAVQRGFTLTELMVVVLISGILALIGVGAFRQHLSSSKSVEALTMVQSIRAAQERYRASNILYLDVSQSNTWYPWDPSEAANHNRQAAFFDSTGGGAHSDNGRWIVLNPTVPGPVEFGYQTRAGLPGAEMTEPAEEVSDLTWPTPSEPWYVIQAIADANANGEVAFYLASSLNGEVYTKDEGE